MYKRQTPIQLEQIVTDYEATRKKLEDTKRQKKTALSGVDEVSYLSLIDICGDITGIDTFYVVGCRRRSKLYNIGTVSYTHLS